MPGSLEITTATAEPALLDLPWHLPLESWPEETIAALPKGISRHVVRLAHLADYVVAVKETTAVLAAREYEALKALQRAAVPCVEPIAVITNRRTLDGEPLDPVLVTRHLQFSMPYRAVYSSQRLRPETANRLVDALAVLLARLHLAGFFWGDVSLSNTLFRRDAGAFAAYLVDAETGEFFPELSDGQREHDLEIARVNIAGELLDLQAGDRLDDGLDPIVVAKSIVDKYRSLWKELTAPERFDESERWRINQRVERLNELGFDIEELSIRTDESGTAVLLQPKVVDAGHHSRRLLRLTGLDVEENQARRLLNDLDAFRARSGRPTADEEVVAHEWLTTVFEPVIRAIPRELRGKLEPAEIFHQLLDHRWFRSQEEGVDLPLSEAMTSYIDTVLRHHRDERTFVGAPTTDVLQIIAGEDDDDIDLAGPRRDWRDLV